MGLQFPHYKVLLAKQHISWNLAENWTKCKGTTLVVSQLMSKTWQTHALHTMEKKGFVIFPFFAYKVIPNPVSGIMCSVICLQNITDQFATVSNFCCNLTRRPIQVQNNHHHYSENHLYRLLQTRCCKGPGWKLSVYSLKMTLQISSNIWGNGINTFWMSSLTEYCMPRHTVIKARSLFSNSSVSRADKSL